MTDRARLRFAALAAATLMAMAPPGARAQNDATPVVPDTTYPLVVPVRQVAGANVYLDAGTDHGLETGDTLAMTLDGREQPTGRLTVVAVSAARSVLEQVDGPLDLRSGMVITLHLPRRPTTAVSLVRDREDRSTADRQAPPASRPSGRPSAGSAGGRLYGSMTMDLAAMRSLTGLDGPDANRITRTYATPGFRLSATAPDLMGGFALRTSLRISYRYSDREFAASTWAVRVNTASLERTFERVPLELELGRFRGPGGLFGGYWDGVRARFGGPDLGVGAMAGFQPDRWNASPSTEVPKASVYMDWRREMGPTYWRGDLSIHATRPSIDGMADRTFVGLDQSFRLGRVRLDHEIEVDREPDGHWALGRLRLLGVVSMPSGIRVRAGALRTRHWSLLPVADPLGPVRERASLGLSARPGGVSLSLEGSLSRREVGGDTRDLTGRVSLPPLDGIGGAALGGSVSWWQGDDGSTFLVAPDLAIRAPIQARLGYRFYRSTFADRLSTSHSADVRLNLPLGDRLSANVGFGIRWGEGLRSDRFSIVLHRRF